MRWAKLLQNTCLEGFDTHIARDVDQAVLAQLTDLAWIKQHLNLLITAPPASARATSPQPSRTSPAAPTSVALLQPAAPHR